MSAPKRDPSVPGELSPTPSGGSFDGEWVVEEHEDVARAGYRVTAKLHEERSPYQKIAVYESRFFGRILTLDDLVMFTERDEFVYHEMIVHVPLCAIPDPRSVLIVGGGDCGCLREVLKHSVVERVVQCDIDESVTRVCGKYFPWIAETERDPRAELIFEDGVAFIENHQAAFDLIIIDSTDPVGPAVGLFLESFYRKVASALKPGGVMTAQTESPHWSAPMVGAIYGQLREAFRHTAPYLEFVPCYPSGTWSWAWASADRPHDAGIDGARSEAIAGECRYYNPDVHWAAFALPNFVRMAAEGRSPFGRFDRAR